MSLCIFGSQILYILTHPTVEPTFSVLAETWVFSKHACLGALLSSERKDLKHFEEKYVRKGDRKWGGAEYFLWGGGRGFLKMDKSRRI